MNIKETIQRTGQQAKDAARIIAQASTAQKNAALLAIADKFIAQADLITLVNQKDLAQGKQNGLDEAMLDRLTLDLPKIEGMAEGLRQVAGLQDPVGEVAEMSYRPSGIQLGKMRVPLGVIGIIYESRPNVTADAAALCLKSGNATILRGGSEAIHSNTLLAKIIQEGLKDAGLPAECVQMIETTDRTAVGELLKMDTYIDVLVPRGGKGLVERVSREAAMPVIKHLDGICHVYIDCDANSQKAIDIAYNAKTHRYGVCNAMETLLVSVTMADTVLPPLADKYLNQGVELRGCEQTQAILGDKVVAATEEDWDTEYLAPILSIKVVEDVGAAIAHISKHSSGHTESIVTENYTTGRKFITEVDSASVMINASTRFADGFEYGLGAEIGISTDKLHARGPVGLEGLTTQKWVVFGDGQIRE